MPARCRDNGCLRRVSLIPVRPCEGRLTEPTAAIQPWRRELAFMPHTCRSQYPSGLAQLGGKRDPQHAQPEGQCIGAKSEIDKGVYS